MLLNWKRCTQKASNSSPVAQSKVLFTSSFNKFWWGLSWVLVPVFPFCWQGTGFAMSAAWESIWPKSYSGFFRLLCFIPILHSKTWVVHMAANIEVTSETKKSLVIIETQSDTKQKGNLCCKIFSKKSMPFGGLFLKDFFTIGFQMPSCKGSRHQKWAWQAKSPACHAGVLAWVRHGCIKPLFKLSFKLYWQNLYIGCISQ